VSAASAAPSAPEQDIVLKLVDFGLSRVFKTDEAAVMLTQCGTWAYCAPEVISNQPYTEKVDNWTLGVLMYVLLCGYHPFDPWGNLDDQDLLPRITAMQYDFNDRAWEPVSAEGMSYDQSSCHWTVLISP